MVSMSNTIPTKDFPYLRTNNIVWNKKMYVSLGDIRLKEIRI